jgi:hypothetical protein
MLLCMRNIGFTGIISIADNKSQIVGDVSSNPDKDFIWKDHVFSLFHLLMIRLHRRIPETRIIQLCFFILKIVSNVVRSMSVLPLKIRAQSYGPHIDNDYCHIIRFKSGYAILPQDESSRLILVSPMIVPAFESFIRFGKKNEWTSNIFSVKTSGQVIRTCFIEDDASARCLASIEQI